MTEEQHGTRIEARARMPFYHIAFVLFLVLLCAIGMTGILITAVREGFTPEIFLYLAVLAAFMVIPYLLIRRSFKANVQSMEVDLRRLFADKII